MCLMSSTEDRISALSKKFLDADREPDFDRSFSDADISSMDAVAFAKAVASEFNLEIPAEDFAELSNLRELASYLDSKAG